MTKIFKLFLIVLILGISCAQEDDDNEWQERGRYGDEDRIVNDPDTGPIMISRLPLIKVSSADMGYPNSMDAYLAHVDREILERRQQRYRQQHLPPHRAHMRSMLRPDGWVEDKPGEAIDVPLQTASPNIPPDVIEYFEKSRKNDLALAEAVEKAENEKIMKETEKLKNELYWQKNKGVEKPIPQKQNPPHNEGHDQGKQHDDQGHHNVGHQRQLHYEDNDELDHQHYHPGHHDPEIKKEDHHGWFSDHYKGPTDDHEHGHGHARSIDPMKDNEVEDPTHGGTKTEQSSEGSTEHSTEVSTEVPTGVPTEVSTETHHSEESTETTTECPDAEKEHKVHKKGKRRGKGRKRRHRKGHKNGAADHKITSTTVATH